MGDLNNRGGERDMNEEPKKDKHILKGLLAFAGREGLYAIAMLIMLILLSQNTAGFQHRLDAVNQHWYNQVKEECPSMFLGAVPAFTGNELPLIAPNMVPNAQGGQT